jgi:periplasmic protein TonB
MDDATSDRISRQDLVRWATCALVAVAAHGLLVVAVVARSDEVSDAGSPVVLVELSPILSAPSQTQTDVAPAPEVQNYVPPQMAEEVEHKEKPPEEQVEEAPAPNPEVTLPKREPDPPKEQQKQEAKVEQKAQDEQQETAPQSAPVTAALPASPAQGHNAELSAHAEATWQRAVAARIHAENRYPTGVYTKKGTAKVEFQIDRNGHVLSSRITQSSGSAALDNEALATIKRVDPLPAPPTGISDVDLTIEEVFGYTLPRRR